MEIKIFPRINNSEKEFPIILWKSLKAVLKDKINAFLEARTLRENPYDLLGS